MAEPSDRRFVVGYALKPKKQQSFIRPSLVRTACGRGIDLVPIVPWRPLVEQGPFDCVIHKIYGEDWKFQLAEFAAKNPGVPIVDQPLANIESLRNRMTMLQFVSELKVPRGTETFGVPTQVLIDRWKSAVGVPDAGRAFIQLPVVTKPLVSNDSPKSHRMTLVFTQRSPLPKVEPPFVMQEFINHGGVLFKVYVAGNYVQCVRRKSLPDVQPGQRNPLVALSFSRLCNTPFYGNLEGAELPPSSFLEKIARGLRQATGLRLFNFEMIRDANARNHYFIIDINYFPGYSKMPGYEEFMTNFFWDMVNPRIVVGYALKPKKQQSFIRPSLVRTGRGRGVDLVPIDLCRPLVEQGPFDCVIHKIYGEDWKVQLADFAAKNPGVPIVDHPLANIERLRNRFTMLQFVSELNVPHGTEAFGVPKQLFYGFGRITFHHMTNLRFPIIAKPLVSDDSAESHRMTLVSGPATLLQVKPPVVLQEFVNHSGVMFKVYVAGNYVQCVRRKSLPDVLPEESGSIPFVIFSRESNTLSHNPEDVVDYDEHLEGAELPPSSFLEKIARGLRQVTGLHLFNFEMIRDANARNHFFIIDINYFPGYSKMPGYEQVMTNFFWDMVHRRFVVGYALKLKKQQSFIRPSLVRTAHGRGVDLVPIDPFRPLVEQGPFDCVIHKIYGEDWKFQLAEFAAKNPEVPIVDRALSNIERLRNRFTMLQFVSEFNVRHGIETFGVPKQFLYGSGHVSLYHIINLRFPIIAKPLVSDDSAKSHKMTLIFTPTTLLQDQVKPPVVLQEFVNHGGVMFKVYVAGNYVQCVRRKSLPDVLPEESGSIPFVIFSRESNTLSHNPKDVVDYDEHLEGAELPPSSFLEKIATGLRQATGLHLFNFDMIRDANARFHYFIIDINYFPGYSKMPGYEQVMTNFFWDMVHHKRDESAAVNSSSSSEED